MSAKPSANVVATPLRGVDSARTQCSGRRTAPWLRRFVIYELPPSKRDAITRTRRTHEAFTLAELLVSVFVLAIIILMMAQLMTNASAITRTGQKHITTDTQARAVFDRMAVDFAQMLQRNDIDYFVKGSTSYNTHGHGNGHGWGNGHGQAGQQGSDQIAFFSQVPGYNPSTGSSSPVSLVAYRVNQSTNTNPAWLRLERLGKGLIWNAANGSTCDHPLAFLPATVTSLWPAAVNNNNNNTNNCNNTNYSADPQYETIGAGVFRFEYYYLLKTGKLTDIPWNTDSSANWPLHNAMAGIGLGDVESITVAIAVIDDAGRALLDAADVANARAPGTTLNDLAFDMPDFATSRGRGFGAQKNIGDLEYRWTGILVGDPTAVPPVPGVIVTGQTSGGYPVPREAAKAIRIYSKTFDLRNFP